METLGGLPMLTEGVTCPYLLYFDIKTPTVDLGMPGFFETSTCENFWLSNRTAISRAKRRGLTQILPTLTRILMFASNKKTNTQVNVLRQ